MKLCDLTYVEAMARHPQAVQDLMKKLRSGKSKHRNAVECQLSWHYEVCVSVPSYSISDMMSGKIQQDRQRLEAMSLEDQAQEHSGRTQTGLMASIGRWRDSIAVPNPPEVYEWALKLVTQKKQEQDAFDALTPAERGQQFRAAIETVSKFPGFRRL